MERVGGRWEKMEGYCSTGQNPQWAVVPMEEEEEEEEEDEVEEEEEYYDGDGDGDDGDDEDDEDEDEDEDENEDEQILVLMKNYLNQIYGCKVVRFSLHRWQVRDRGLFQYSVGSTVFADHGLWTPEGHRHYSKVYTYIF